MDSAGDRNVHLPSYSLARKAYADNTESLSASLAGPLTKYRTGLAAAAASACVCLLRQSNSQHKETSHAYATLRQTMRRRPETHRADTLCSFVAGMSLTQPDGVQKTSTLASSACFWVDSSLGVVVARLYSSFFEKSASPQAHKIRPSRHHYELHKACSVVG